MKPWIDVIIEWLNCLDVLETNVKDLKELDNGKLYEKLIELFSWQATEDSSKRGNIIVTFLQDEYPEYKFDHKDLVEMEHVYIASLFLLHVSQEPLFYQPMCNKLQHETQLKIKAFLEMIIPHGKNVNRQLLKDVINELERDIPNTPLTPKVKTLKDFFNSPAARSVKSCKLLGERSRELRLLKTELEIERFEKADLQEDLRIQQCKVQNLQKKLQEKTAELKALREEKLKPNTPQSCKKNKNTEGYQRCYKKEIDRLEDQLMQKQCEIDKLEAENDTLTKKLTCMGKQCGYFKEKLESYEKSLDLLEVQAEIKDRELANLRMTNEELRTHLKELSKTPIVLDQSFEIDGIAPLNSPSSSFNNSEILSSVIDIQLQEAKEESELLKAQLDALNKKLEQLNQDKDNATKLLKEKTQILQDTEAKLNETFNKLSNEITALKEEKQILIDKHKNLEMTCNSQKESLSQIKESKNALNNEVITLEENIKQLKESLRNENINNSKLNTDLTEIKSQVCRNLKRIGNITKEHNFSNIEESKDSINLKQATPHNVDDNNTVNLEDKSVTQLLEQVETMLSNLDKKCSSRDKELELLEKTIKEQKLKLDVLQSQMSEMKDKDAQMIKEVFELREKIAVDAMNIEQYETELASLKQVELENETLTKDLQMCEQEIHSKKLLLQASSRCIQTLKQTVENLAKDYHVAKKLFSNLVNEYEKQNIQTSENILNAQKMLILSYNKEQKQQECCIKQLECELIDNKTELTEIKNINNVMESDLAEKKKAINILENKLTGATEKLSKSIHRIQELEETNEKYEKQQKHLKSENDKALLDLGDIQDKFKHSQQEIFNVRNQMKIKEEEVNNLSAEIACLNLKNEHIMRLQVDKEAEMNNFLQELETKLLEKQHDLDKLTIDMKLKQETLELVQDKFEKLSKEKITSEMKKKEVIMNLQEVRSNQDAVLKTQEKALKEKSLQMENQEKEFNELKSTLKKQLKEEKLRFENLQGAYSGLEKQLLKQTQTIDELQETLKKERDRLNKQKEYCSTEDIKKLKVAEVCEKLEYSINSLKSTIKESCLKSEIFYPKTTNDVSCTYNDDIVENILRILNSSIFEIHASRKLILELSNVNENLKETLENQKVIVDSYVKKCEEIKLLKTRIQESNDLQQKYVERVNDMLKCKGSLKDSLQCIIKSREDLDVSLHELKEKWNKLLSKSQSTFAMDKSICDELKQLYIEKSKIENTLVKCQEDYFENSKPLQNILWQEFLSSEKLLKDTRLNATAKIQTFDNCFDILSEDKMIMESEFNKSTLLRSKIVELQDEMDAFSNLIASFERNVSSNKIQLKSPTEKKLQIQIDELLEDKQDLESKLKCARVRNAKLEDDIEKLKFKMQEAKVTSSEEMEDLKKDLSWLKEEHSKLLEERKELNKRLKKEDVDKQLKDIHDKYKVKLDEIKQTMKTAYNEQITKLNREQEQCIQERLETLQKKMELQCRKQADELSKYKAHVAGMSSQIWNVGEKLLSERQEKEKLQKELNELKAKYQNYDKKVISSIEHAGSKYEKKENKEEVSHKVAIVQEKTTYERRYSIRSIQTMGNAFNAEDEEGEVFDNIYLADMKNCSSLSNIDADRISTLKKRNALCKPHLKSSYPAEMQFHPLAFSEDEIKAGATSEDVFNDSLSQSLLPEQKARKKDRTQTSYKKPGPPTPSKNGGRLSLQSNEVRSPNSRILKERNKDRATTTPRRLKSLFISRRQDENSVSNTPRGRRRSNIFRIHRSTNDR